MKTLPSQFRSAKGEAEYMAAYEATMRLWPVPYESMKVPSRFGTTHLVACGAKDAPPLVLLHSFFMSLTVWAHNSADFSRGYRVYALDMMGQPGKSIPDQPIRNREEMAEWLTATLDALGLDQTDLVGWSYGGFSALNFAVHRPNRVRRLILLTPIGSFVPLKGQFYIRGMLTRLPGRFWSNSMMRWFFHAPNLNDKETKKMFDCLMNQFYPGLRYFRLPTTVLPTPYQDRELRSVRIPTLLLIGRQEALYDPVAAEARARRVMPNIKSELIAQAGHELALGRPEIVNRKVLEFLNE